jgi:hypothetical protein
MALPFAFKSKPSERNVEMKPLGQGIPMEKNAVFRNRPVG